jgi:hypothetical protein
VVLDLVDHWITHCYLPFGTSKKRKKSSLFID